jgi:perosamine synthetase
MMPVAGPWITAREVEYVRRAAETGWYAGANQFNEQFETSFAAHTARRHALSLPSCTAAIHLVLASLGIGPGDEVIVPDITWIASVAPVEYVGATPVFADVDQHTWCLRADTVAACLTERTRAIIAVDLYGSMPDMDALTELAGLHGVALIEDAAEAIGSTWRARPAGSFGRASVFSFHGSKTLTTGEGGMVVTDDDALHARMAKLRDHGRQPGSTDFFNDEIGFKYKMSSMQAALGLAQLERIDELVARKRQIFGWYERRLSGVEGVMLNSEPQQVHNSYWMVTAVTDRTPGITGAGMRRRLTEQGIGSRPFFHPLSSLPPFEGRREAAEARERNEVSYWLSPRGVNLPSALILEETDVARVSSALVAMIDGAG